MARAPLPSLLGTWLAPTDSRFPVGEEEQEEASVMSDES